VPSLARRQRDRTVSEAASPYEAELVCRKAGQSGLLPQPTSGAPMNLTCLGIDIAKVKFNACLLLLTGKLKHKVFPNNAAGFRLRDCLRFAAAVFRE